MPTRRSSAAQTCRVRAYAWVLCAAVVLSALLVACGSGDQPLDEVDPAAVAANPTYDQVFTIVHNRCATCHTDGNDEYAALETCEGIVGLRDDIVVRIEDNTMPPGAMPRLSTDEKLLIRRWVENGAPAPCN